MVTQAIEGNFIQLLKLQGETDAELRAWLEKTQEKYVSGDIQCTSQDSKVGS